jgi:hypothetical protein
LHLNKRGNNLSFPEGEGRDEGERSTNHVVLAKDGTREALALERPHFTIEQTAGRSKLTTSPIDYDPLATSNDWQMSDSIYEPAVV